MDLAWRPKDLNLVRQIKSKWARQHKQTVTVHVFPPAFSAFTALVINIIIKICPTGVVSDLMERETSNFNKIRDLKLVAAGSCLCLLLLNNICIL